MVVGQAHLGGSPGTHVRVCDNLFSHCRSFHVVQLCRSWEPRRETKVSSGAGLRPARPKQHGGLPGEGRGCSLITEKGSLAHAAISYILRLLLTNDKPTQKMLPPQPNRFYFVALGSCDARGCARFRGLHEPKV